MAKKITTEELKSLQVEILQSVHDFCVEKHLNYTLGFGSLLGAIRHKGFIPWDDDIDIMMPRADYEKFVLFYKHDFYKVYDFRYDEDYVLPFAKIADTRTMLEEIANIKNIGINIDIFPLDPLFDTKEESAAFLQSLIPIKRKFRMKILKPSPKNVWWKRIAIQVSKILVWNASLKDMAAEIDSKIKDLNVDKAKYWGTPADTDPYANKSLYESLLFDTYLKVSFEGRQFFAPSGYDKVLRNYYGDYMQLPPVEKRTSPHSLNNIYWLEK